MLLIGYGNPGRCDDGLGPAFAARLAAQQLPGLTIASDYQLTVDHAMSISEADQVVFVDADLDAEPPYRFGRISAAAHPEIGSHSLDPSSVLALTRSLYGVTPAAFVLGIAGHEFGEVREGLSAFAKHNLDRAETFFIEWLSDPAVAAK